jgi:hypothetical protein
MSLQSVLGYVNRRPVEGGSSIAEMYGTEYFGLLLHSVIRMCRPNVVVELGAGACATTCLAAEALKENGKGHIWSVDNGDDWQSALKAPCQTALDYSDAAEGYPAFFARLMRGFELEPWTTLVPATLTDTSFYAPATDKIDIVFADAPPSDARGCINLLRYYLPKMRRYSSIFIDRASTINHSYLLLNYVVDQLNGQRIPLQLLSHLDEDEERAMRELVRDCKFSIVHLTEANEGKLNKLQNSRAWLRIEPNDYLPHNNVASLVRILPTGQKLDIGG